MKKPGYTLAEVLIAIAVVGVVASMTIPNVVSSQKKQLQGAALANAVSDLESAMSTMIMKEGAVDLFETPPWRALDGDSLDSATSMSSVRKFVGALGKSITISGFSQDSYYPDKVKALNARDAAIDPTAEFVTLETKKGYTYFISISDSKEDTNAKLIKDVLFQGGNMTAQAADIIIDVNGKSVPNMIGRDIFFFYLASDGKLYPHGGIDAYIYKTDTAKTWKNSGIWTCSDLAIKNNSVGNHGKGCTARVIEKGYKIDY